MTLIAEWNKVDMPFEVQGVWTVIQTDEELSPWLQFEEVSGTSIDYERELTLPTTSTVADEGDISSSNRTFTEKSETLKTVVVQEDLNKKAKALAHKQDKEAILKVGMAKSFGRKLADLIVNGDDAVDDTEFKGLEKWCRTETRMMAMDDGVVDGPGTAETELTITRFREFIDLVQLGGPQILMMNKTMRRKLTNLMYAAGGGIQLPSIEMFGRRVELFDTIPIVINDYISKAEQYADSSTWGSSTATTIYALRFGAENQGFTLCHNGGFLDVELENLGTRKNKNAEVWRAIAYPGSVVYSPLTIAALGGIDSAA